MEKYRHALDNILKSRNKQANIVLKACINIMNAFIKLNKEQRSKNIEMPTANDWISKAEVIIADIQTAMATPID